jgi:hypothetical protein
MGKDMLLVGGDFEKENVGSAARAQFEGGEGLHVSALPAPRGYRSGAACTPGPKPQCVAVGPTGIDQLVESRWTAVSDIGYDAVDLGGDVGWASGADGRIARIEIKQ